jgi:hypothetical protein
MTANFVQAFYYSQPGFLAENVPLGWRSFPEKRHLPFYPIYGLAQTAMQS